MMSVSEHTLVFECEGSKLVGILHRPAAPTSYGVVVVVGGPQYRVGSHRQFLLLARGLAERGIPVLRFDYRGMGDSEGAAIGFEDTGPDISAAIDLLFKQIPQLNEVIIWGLCDGASAAVLYANSDDRVSGLVLLNPWIRTESGQASTYLRHYYVSHFASPDLWKRMFSGKLDLQRAIKDLGKNMFLAFKGISGVASSCKYRRFSSTASADDCAAAQLPEKMLVGWRRFRGPILLILSGNDLTAAEFKSTTSTSRDWRRLVEGPNVTRHELSEATHTFPREEWRSQVLQWTAEWIERI